MLLNIREKGLQEAANNILNMAKENRTARKSAVKDVGQAVKKQLSQNRKSGAGLQPLGFISKKLGNKKPWGKKKFAVYVPKNYLNPAAIVTTKGANKVMEEGGQVTISPKFRKKLHYLGIHLRGKGTLKMNVPARPLFKITWRQMSGKIAALYSERFFYQLERALRRRQFVKA